MLKLMLKKFVGTVKIVRSVRDSTQLGLNLKARVFQHLTKVLNIGVLEIINNLKLDLLEIVDFDCNFHRKVLKPARECEHRYHLQKRSPIRTDL